MNNKKVIPIIEKGSNYIFHILALAKIGYDSSYAEIYNNTMNSHDLEYLKFNERLLRFANGDRGELTLLYIFLPCKINLDTQEKIDEYFSFLVEAIKMKSIKRFYEKYKDDIEYLKKMWGLWWEEDIAKIIESGIDCSDEAEKIANIFKRNFKTYEEYVWVKEEVKLKEFSTKLGEKLEKVNIIEGIEKFIGLTYDEEVFRVSLCSANDNGPDANDLGYNKNLHFYKKDVSVIIHFITHEIIIRLIVPISNKLWAEYKDIDNSIKYKAIEMLAEFCAIKILNDGIKMEWYKEFLELYEGAYKKDKSIEICKFLRLGFEYKE